MQPIITTFSYPIILYLPYTTAYYLLGHFTTPNIMNKSNRYNWLRWIIIGGIIRLFLIAATIGIIREASKTTHVSVATPISFLTKQRSVSEYLNVTLEYLNRNDYALTVVIILVVILGVIVLIFLWCIPKKYSKNLKAQNFTLCMASGFRDVL